MEPFDYGLFGVMMAMMGWVTFKSERLCRDWNKFRISYYKRHPEEEP